MRSRVGSHRRARNQRFGKKMEFELLYTVVTPGLEQGHITLLPELQDPANYPIVWVEADRFVAVWRDSIDAFNDKRKNFDAARREKA